MRLVAAAAMLLLCPLAAVAHSESRIDPARLDALVNQLGDPLFENRFEAHEELAKIGMPARERLLEARKNPDPEIRHRAKRLIKRIDREHHKGLVSRFEADLDNDEIARQLPGWERYLSIVDDSPEARKQFIRMQRAEPRLMRSEDGEAGEVTDRIASRIINLKMRLSYGEKDRVTIHDFCAALFAASRPDVKLPATVQSALYSLANNVKIRKTIEDVGNESPPRKLLGAWIKKPHKTYDYSKCRLAMRYEIPEGLEPARRILKAGGAGTRIGYAILTFSRCGSAENVAELEQLFDNKNIAYPKRNKSDYHVQVRDLALLTALKLTKQNHRKYGFPRVRSSSTYGFSISTCGFASDKQREAAFQKWKARKQHSDAAREDYGSLQR